MSPGCLRVWVLGLRPVLCQLIFVFKYWYELYNNHHRLSCHESSQKPAGLADFQLFLCQKLHHRRACSARGGFNLVVLPKIAGEKKKMFSHYFTAWAKAMGESQYGRRWRRRTQSRLRKRLLSGYPAVPQQKLCVPVGRQPAPGSASGPSILVLVCLDTSAHTAATCWHVHQTCSMCLSYLHSVTPPGCISFFRPN